jgi:hypothetical protein
MDWVTAVNSGQERSEQPSPNSPNNHKTESVSKQSRAGRFPGQISASTFRWSFAFVVNGAVIESDVAEAAALSPLVREQLSADACAREFVICDSEIGSPAIASLSRLLSGAAISVRRSEVLMSDHFGNAALESLLLGCSQAGIAATLSGTVTERRMDVESADLSILSFEALDDLLLTSSVIIENEDSLLQLFLHFGSGYRLLLRHIQLGFLSNEALSLLADHFEFPPESVWRSAAEAIQYPPPGPLDSLIVSSFPALFTEFSRKQFSLLWRGSRDGFKASNFHGRCDGHANTLTVVLDTDGNTFGGFTPVEWESRTLNSNPNFSSLLKADESLKSFLFTLKHPQNVPVRKFALKKDMGQANMVKICLIFDC